MSSSLIRLLAMNIVSYVFDFICVHKSVSYTFQIALHQIPFRNSIFPDRRCFSNKRENTYQEREREREGIIY